MERELYKILDLDLRVGRLNKRFELSREFEKLHNDYIGFVDKKFYFNLEPNIKVNRKDQLLLNLQYNNLLYSYNIHDYNDYCNYVEEFCTYFLNYEVITGYCSPKFTENIKNIFSILNKYNN